MHARTHTHIGHYKRVNHHHNLPGAVQCLRGGCPLCFQHGGISPGAVYSHLTWCSVQPSHLVQCTAISPGAVYSSSRHARRLSSVFSTPTESSLLPVVALDSSEARMPLPRCARKVCGCGCRISEKPVTRRALRVNFLPLVASDKRKAIARTTQLQWR